MVVWCVSSETITPSRARRIALVIDYCIYTNTDCDRGCPFCMFASTTSLRRRVDPEALSDALEVLSSRHPDFPIDVTSMGESLLHPALGEIGEVIEKSRPRSIQYVTSGAQNDQEMQRFWEMQLHMRGYPRYDAFSHMISLSDPALSDVNLSVDWREASLRRLANMLEVSLGFILRFRQGLRPEDNVELIYPILRRSGFSRRANWSESEEWSYNPHRAVYVRKSVSYAFEGRAARWLPNDGSYAPDGCFIAETKKPDKRIFLSPYGISHCSNPGSWKYPLSREGMERALDCLASDDDAARKHAAKYSPARNCNGCPACA